MDPQDLRLRLRALFLRKQVEQDLEDELDFHIEMEARRNTAKGMSANEARRQAGLRFGAQALVRDQCRDERRINFIETLVQDLRYASRGFRRAPAFALTVIVTIALGLGLNVAVFTIFNAYVLRPLEVRDPYSLYEFGWMTKSGERSFTEQEVKALREADLPFSSIYANRNLQLRINGRQSFGELVTGNYFRMLGVGAAFGRTLTPEDSSAPGREPVMVLSYNAWKSMFGADRAILGRKILVHGYPLEVVGVAQEGFGGLAEVPEDFWAPLSMIAQLDPDRTVRLRIIGRLSHSVSVSQAEASLALLAPRLTADRPDSERAIGAALHSRATSVRVSRQAVLVLAPVFAAFGLVLVIACANVANIMLARAMARQREIGIRLSLGAARARLIRQLLTESILLAIPAGFLALAISQGTIAAGMRIMLRTLPAEFIEYVRLVPLTPDARVFAFMMAAAVAAAVIFGLAPAIQATRAGVIQAARGDFTNEYRPARLRNLLVVAQIAGCSALLICACVLLRSANQIGKLDTGLRTRDVIEIEVQEKHRQHVLSTLAADPIVQMLGATGDVPLDSRLSGVRLSDARSTVPLATAYNHVSPEFFSVFDIPILRGRNFSADEARTSAPVALVSEALARRIWPAGDAVGKSLRFDSNTQSQTRGPQKLAFQNPRVIGIVRDVNTGLVDDDAQRSCLYLPTSPADKDRALVIRVNGDTETARQKLDQSLSHLYPDAIQTIHKMQEFVAARSYPFRAAYWVSATVSGIALFLTITGIYGVLSYLVSQRTREIGIRMAMGASVKDVVAVVLHQSVRLTLSGIGVAVVLAYAMLRVFASQILLMKTLDALSYGIAILLVFGACMAAAFFPSRRAARIDPSSTLRFG